MAKKPNIELPPAVPGVQNLHALVTLLNHAGESAKWLKDAQKILDANEKACKLMGAPDELEAALEAVEKAEAKAKTTLESAAARASSIAAEAEAKFAQREKAITEREGAFADLQNETNKNSSAEKAAWTDKLTRREREVAAAEESQKAYSEELAEREKAVVKREKAAEAKMTTAMEIQQSAMNVQKRLTAALADE